MPSELKNLNLDYFYGEEANQFSYFRIPKILMSDNRFAGVQVEAKMLYGMLLDRMGLSIKNKWCDEQGRVFVIFSLKEVMRELNISHQKATKLFKQLDTVSGVGLIERKAAKCGMAKRIYVKNFASLIGIPSKPDIPAVSSSAENQQSGDEFSTMTTAENQQCGNSGQEVFNNHVQNQQCTVLKISTTDCTKSAANKTYQNDLNQSHFSSSSRPRDSPHLREDEEREKLKQEIDYDDLIEVIPTELPRIHLLIEILLTIRRDDDPLYPYSRYPLESCLILELLEVMNSIDTRHVHAYTPYLVKTIKEELQKHFTGLARIEAGHY